MNMQKITKIILTLSMLAFVEAAYSQTERNVIVEHFTNTRCGICGSKNPSLHQNLASASEVYHISYHPSSPYSSCLLNQHNKSGNDDRTNYYGIYGATPRVVVQGKVQSGGVNFGSSSLYTSEQGETTPVGITLNTIKKGNDSLVVRAIIKATESHSLSDLNLTIFSVEDTVFYNAPNGENRHYNVYRNTMIDEAINLPQPGDSLVIFARTVNHQDWDAQRMYALAIVQNSSTKSIEQVQSSEEASGQTASIDELTQKNISVYPNPAQDVVYVDTPLDLKSTVFLSDFSGRVLQTKAASGQLKMDISTLSSGMYIVSIESNGSIFSKKIIKH